MDSRQSELASALVEHIDTGVITLDTELRIRYGNNVVSQCSGKRLEQAQQQPLSRLFPEADSPCLSRLPFDTSRQPAPPMRQNALQPTLPPINEDAGHHE